MFYFQMLFSQKKKIVMEIENQMNLHAIQTKVNDNKLIDFI